MPETKRLKFPEVLGTQPFLSYQILLISTIPTVVLSSSYCSGEREPEVTGFFVYILVLGFSWTDLDV